MDSKILDKIKKSVDNIEEKVVDVMMYTKLPSIGGKSNFQIIDAIARNNRCQAYTWETAKSNKMILVGTPDNVEVVKRIADVVTPIFVSEGKKIYEEEYLPDCASKPVGLDTYLRRFIEGAANGLNDKLMAEKAQFYNENNTKEVIDKNGISCTVLAKINELAIAIYAEKKHGKKIFAARRKTVTSGKIPNAYGKGCETGKNVQINKRA